MACRRFVALAAVSWLVIGASPLWAASFAVNTTADGTDGVCTTATGGCTLRDAVRAANATGATDIISLPAGTFTLTVAGSGEDLAATGDLDLRAPVTITGQGVTATIIDIERRDRVFDIFDTAGTVIIQNLTVRNGFSGAGVLAGGIWNSAVLSLRNARVESCEGRLGGGGILNDNDLTATDVTLSGNVTNSQGGGLYNTGVARLERVTVSGSTSAAAGGGIANDGTLTLTNVTLSGNTAGTDGGGLNNGAGTATLKSVTVAGNGANRGGGVFFPEELTLGNTIVANNTPGGNCAGAGTLTSLGANLDSANTCGFTGTTNRINANPLLTPLQSNGGPTLTHGLLLGSPAVDLGGTGCPGTLTTDQRSTGFPRVLDGDGNGTSLCDSGAYELNFSSPPTTTSTTTIPTTSTTSSTSTSTSTTRPTTTSTSTSTTRPTTTSTSTSTTRPTTTSTSTSTTRPTTTSTSTSTTGPTPTSTSTSTTRPTTTSTSTSTTRPTTTSTSTSTTRPTTTSTSTSSSTSSSTTSTTLAGGVCGAPRTDCVAPTDASLAIDEGGAGRERFKLVLRRLVPDVVQAQLGNPATGTTRYDVCVYDGALRLVGNLTVDRAAETCGGTTRPCWRSIPTKGYRYTDRAAEADGVRSIVALGGAAGRGRIVVKARNDARRGQLAMPLGMTAALQSSQSVTVQAVTSDGDCFGGTLTDVRTADPTRFRAE